MGGLSLTSQGIRYMCAAAVAICCACAPTEDRLTISGSAVGREADVLREQLQRFSATHGIHVEIRATPDSADQRHQLYVQWLSAHAADPDVLQLDVIWMSEFAAAGWLLPLDRLEPAMADFFPAAIAANRWRGSLFGLPWFVDAGMLYWRTDLLERPPRTFDELTSMAHKAMASGVRTGIAWQGARYEGLVTVFLEVLGGFGGRILDDRGAVVVDDDAAVRALTWMRDGIHVERIAPDAVLTWQEEQVRFVFQNGEAAMMRNWPYAHALLQARDSQVAGRVGIAPMPAQPDGGKPTAALGGAQLAINARSTQPDAAWRLIQFLTAPEQMLDRARGVGQFPSRPSLFERGAGLDDTLGIPPDVARQVLMAAHPRPVTPVYTQLSEILQIRLHRALSRQQEPRAALTDAAHEMRRLLQRAGL